MLRTACVCLRTVTGPQYIRDVIKPTPAVATWPGRWVGVEWPIPWVLHEEYVLGADGNLLPSPPPAPSPSSASTAGSALGVVSSDDVSEKGTGAPSFRAITASMHAGLFAGAWLSFGGPDLAPDQRVEDGNWAVFNTPPLDQQLTIAGFVHVEVVLRVGPPPPPPPCAHASGALHTA